MCSPANVFRTHIQVTAVSLATVRILSLPLLNAILSVPLGPGRVIRRFELLGKVGTLGRLSCFRYTGDVSWDGIDLYLLLWSGRVPTKAVDAPCWSIPLDGCYESLCVWYIWSLRSLEYLYFVVTHLCCSTKIRFEAPLHGFERLFHGAKILELSSMQISHHWKCCCNVLTCWMQFQGPGFSVNRHRWSWCTTADWFYKAP